MATDDDSEAAAKVFSNLSVNLMEDFNVTMLRNEQEGWAYRDTFEFIVHGVLVGIVGVFGLVGNILSIVILSRPQGSSSRYFGLRCMCSSDMWQKG